MSMPEEKLEDRMQELMQLLQESEAQGVRAPEEESGPSKEELLRELREGESDEVLTGHQATAMEFQMMMTHFEALAADYERREAEEAAQRKAAGEGAS